MQAGKLDRRITLERFTVTQDDYGQEIKTWEVLASVWAAVNAESRQTKGNERFEAHQQVAVSEHIFQIRYLPGLTSTTDEKMRIVYRNALYNILDVKEIGRREGLEIITEKKDSGFWDGS
ncbi:phage head closure protein [Rapidithrix thailandica]|uniref:Phage head closure protein n=1 Tax=Rapidithrix thailandica TaxID=413964 RepID=A0AAW9SA11_9BACT